MLRRHNDTIIVNVSFTIKACVRCSVPVLCGGAADGGSDALRPAGGVLAAGGGGGADAAGCGGEEQRVDVALRSAETLRERQGDENTHHVYINYVT